MSDIESAQAENTDRELWRKQEGDYYAPSIFVTKYGAIGIKVGGHAIVQTAERWHEAARDRTRLAEVEAENGRLRHSLGRAELDLRGVSGFVYTGPTDDHMRKAAALIEAAIDRARAALAQTKEPSDD